MSTDRKTPDADLRNYYTILLETGLIVVLVLFIGAMKMELRSSETQPDLTEEQEIVEIEEIERTEQENDPPPPPRPQVPVEVPNDEIIEDEEINLDADLSTNDAMEMPPPPEEAEEDDEEEEIFRVVERMPEVVGGQKALQNCVEYPSRARRAGIEGTVTVQFVVTENGNVEDTEVIRSLGGGLDEEAVRCVEAMEFRPGQQRGEPVNVRFTLPVIFRLQ